MSFLLQGNSTGYYKVLNFGQHGNYAVCLSQDFTVITCEKSEQQEGIYNQENILERDPEIIKSINSMFNTEPNSDGYDTLDEFIQSQITSILAEQLKFYPVLYLPKLNKTIINGINNLDLNICIDCSDATLPTFCCVGANEYFVNKDVIFDDLVFINPSRFYVATSYSTRYNTKEVHMRIAKNASKNAHYMYFANTNVMPDKIALCGAIDRNKFFEFQKEIAELE